MMKTKAELRPLVIKIIQKPDEKVPYDVWQLTGLFNHVAWEFVTEPSKKLELNLNRARHPQLDEHEKMLVQEIFWDLFIEKVITCGHDRLNDAFPSYRLHTDAMDNLKRGTS